MSLNAVTLTAQRDVQRRTLGTLSVAQILGNLGAGAAPSVGILLATAVVHSEAWAGVARSATTLGSALAAVPLGALALRWGRRGALGAAYATASVGSATLLLAAVWESAVLLVVGMMAIGVGTAANFQMRFAAADLSLPERRGRAIALVVWVGTLGSVIGPNLGVPGEWLEARFGLPEYSGAFAIAAVLMALSGAVLVALLRPDPLLLAIRLRSEREAADHARAAAPPGARGANPDGIAGEGTPVDIARDGTAVGVVRQATPDGLTRGAAPDGVAPPPVAPPRTTVRAALRLVATIPTARFALVAQVLAHVVMVAIMTMTPVHLDHHGARIGAVGIVISFHVLGMFGLAPIVGWASDRFGPVPVILAGQIVLGAGAVVSAAAGPSRVVVGVGLFLVGVGWSVVTVPTAAMLTGSVSAGQRPVVQGSGDMAMNAAAALGAIVSGPIVVVWGFAALCLLTLPFLVVVVVEAVRLRRVAERVPADPLGH